MVVSVCACFHLTFDYRCLFKVCRWHWRYTHPLTHEEENNNRTSPPSPPHPPRSNDTFLPDRTDSGRQVSFYLSGTREMPQSGLWAHTCAQRCHILIHFIPRALSQLREISKHTPGRARAGGAAGCDPAADCPPFWCPVIFSALGAEIHH